jgi:hypothetical protein
MEPEGNRRSAGPVIDAEMNKCCQKVTQLVTELEKLRKAQDRAAIPEKIKELRTEIQRMGEINKRAMALE